MKLYVVRHGHTNYNRLGILSYDPKKDVHLTHKGLNQAKAVAEKLKDVPLTMLFVSDLKRTHQTAEIINLHHNLELIEDKRITELHTGYEGKQHLLWKTALLKAKDPLNVRFNNGESLMESRARVTEFVNELAKKFPNDTVLLVTHGNTAEIIWDLVNKTPKDKLFKISVKNGQLLEFDL